jgi:hypothetical protein
MMEPLLCGLQWVREVLRKQITTDYPDELIQQLCRQDENYAELARDQDMRAQEALPYL